MKKKITNKQLFRIMVIAMIAVLIILGGTYAWIRIGLSANKTNIIKAGALDLRIDESPTDGDEIRLERAIPQSYRQGLTNKPYKFTLINNSTIDTDYTISLEDFYVGDDASLTDSQKIADSLIRYILVKNDDELVATNSKLLSTGRTIDAGTISGKTGNEAVEIPYTLYVWIDSKAGDDGTEADIMDKIFNARLNITAEQHHVSGEYADKSKGDVILFNPVTLEYCNSTAETNCYEWVILNKIDDNKIDLMYLAETEALTLTDDAFVQLEKYTRNWNDKLIVPDEYNLPETSSPPYGGYDYRKARLPKNSEMTDEIRQVLEDYEIAKLSGGSTPNSLVTAYNDTNFGMYGITGPSSFYAGSTSPYIGSSSYLNSGPSKYYVHPVIRLGEQAAEATAGDNQPEYQVGDKVNFNPVTARKCTQAEADSNLYTTGTSTTMKDGCMNWYVIEDGGEYIDVLLDHNTTPLTYFYNTHGDNHLYNKLKEDTRHWSSVLTLYDVINGFDYAGYKARLIAATEIAKITGNTDFSVSETSDGTSFTNTVGWLFENTLDCRYRSCQTEDNNAYNMDYFENQTHTIEGYWTSDEVGGTGVWTLDRDGYFNKALESYDGRYGIRPVIRIPKARLK